MLLRAEIQRDNLKSMHELIDIRNAKLGSPQTSVPLDLTRLKYDPNQSYGSQ